MGTKTLRSSVCILGVMLGYCTPSFGHGTAVAWVQLLMPSCEKHVDGFTEKSAIPYAEWRQKHSEELREYKGSEVPEREFATPKELDRFKQHCEKLLSYIADDIRPHDPRFATPQGTWNVLIQAFRSGDRATISDCLTADARGRYMSAFEQMTPAQLADIGRSFKSFELLEAASEDFQEAVVSRGDLAGIALFVRTSRGWQLSQL